MKKLITISIAILFSIALNAQYLQNHNINNTDYGELTKDQLDFALTKAEKNISTGKVLVGVGAGVTVVGVVIYVASLNSIIESTDLDFTNEMTGSTAGTLLALGGGTMVGIGIPVWIGGSNKKESIEIHLQKFKTLAQKSIPGIGLTLTF